MMIYKNVPLMQLVLCLALALGCSKGKHSSDQPAPMPKDFTIVFGEGGGVTGQWQGYTISADGVVSNWQGRAPGDNAQDAGKLSSKQMRQLWEQVHQTGALTDSTRQHGNMTAFMKITANDSTHEISWVPGVGVKTSAASVQQLFQQCQSLASQAKAN